MREVIGPRFDDEFATKIDWDSTLFFFFFFFFFVCLNLDSFGSFVLQLGFMASDCLLLIYQPPGF